jgi:hypothetical protein
MLMSLLRGRIWILGAVAAAAVTGSVAAAPSTAAAPAAASAVRQVAASTSHPFSDPHYYMFHGVRYVRMDCVVSNPGCSPGHTDESMTLQTLNTTTGGPGHYLQVPVYPTGAGIVHIGAIHTAACGASAPPLGNWVWVDHGGGTVTRYAHLSAIAVTEGQYVTPTTQLAKTGNSGERSTCYVYYLNYQLKRGGFLHGTPVPLGTLRGCDHLKTVTYPTVMNPAWTTFNKVPKGTFFRLSDPACVPTGTPATLRKPTIGALSRSGSGSLTAHWTAAPNPADFIQVELRLWHPSTGTWEDIVRHNIAVGSTVPTSYKITGLVNGSSYEARVSFHNPIGWSLPSNYSAPLSPA